MKNKGKKSKTYSINRKVFFSQGPFDVEIPIWNLKLKASICEFLKGEVLYLGYVVPAEDIKTDPSKTDDVRNMPVPKNVKDVRSFFRFACYLGKFVYGFARIARPLNDPLIGAFSDKGEKKKNSQKMSFTWEEKHQHVFDSVIKKLTTAPILAYAYYSTLFILHINASTSGLGSVLFQKQDDGLERPIAYASKSLKLSERKYHASKLEFLTLKWAVTEKFHEVPSDNNPLTYINTSTKLDATGYRWESALGNYNYSLRYRSRKTNVVADAL